MKNMRSLTKRAAITSLYVVCFSYGHSQSITNSAYNVFGIGTLEQAGLVSYEAMGYASLGARPTDIVNVKNPAALNSIRGFTQIVDFGITYSNLSQRANDDSFSSSFGGLHDLNYWFRANSKTAFSVGIAKFSEASYDILDSRSGSDVTGRSDSRHLGEGGSSEVYLAGSYAVLKNLHFGLKTRFLFSSQHRDELLSVTDPTINLEIENEQRFTKTMLEAGLQYEYRFGENKGVVLGSTFRTGGNASVAQEERIIGNSGNSIDTLSSEDDYRIYLPQKIGVGLGLTLKSWSFNFDYEFENWGLNESQDGFEYRDRFITSFGAQYVRNSYSEKLIERIAFRFGGGMHSNYVVVEKEDYLSQYYSFGLGVPIRKGAAALNLSYQFYATGTSSFNLIEERASTFSFSITIRDVWFRKRAFD